MTAGDEGQEWTDHVGKYVSAIFIVLLTAVFVYAYLGRFVYG